jgi:putative DNA primase/helicase
MSFRATIEAAGLRPREVIADGRIRRCRTESKPQHRNGWYVLHPDGRGYWGDWTSGSGGALGEWKDSVTSYMPPSPAALAKIQAQRERDRAYRQSAIRGARAFWAKARPLNRPHPYIERKGLTPLGCAGLRQHNDLLVVPVMWGDTLTSVQTISPTGEKLFWPGAPVDGGAYVLRRPGAAVTVLAEGLSTALAVFQAVRMASVICCFNAGNLLKAVQHLKPTGSVVFAADNDHATLARRGFNPGIQAATNAAELIGAGVAWPEGIEGTDWADYLAEVGEGAARKVERLILAKAKYVMGASV